MKKLFIGVPIYSPNAWQHVDRWSSDGYLNLNRMVWTRPPNWHVTLFFLGATPESQVTLLGQLIGDSFREVSPFTPQLSGLGVFPENRKPRVLWLGLDLQPLMAAYAELGDLLRENGFPADLKPLKPHLTLARIKSLPNRPPLESLLNEYQSFNFGTVDVNRVTLFESISKPSGVIYEPLFEKWLILF
jgi:2'-5' RNA ligase